MQFRPFLHLGRLALGVALLLGAAPDASGEPAVPSSPEAVRPLGPGSSVPSARVRSVAGEAVDLASLVAERGALLVFYRGGW